MAAKFEYAQAEEIRDVFARHGVRYLFLGKSGAILLGFPDTTQDADLYVEKSPANGAALVVALDELGFVLDDVRRAEIRRGKDFVQLKDGPFDLDLVFAPDGIERFGDAWDRRVPRVASLRHHREQGRGESHQGSRESSAPARVRGLVAGEASSLAACRTNVERYRDGAGAEHDHR